MAFQISPNPRTSGRASIAANPRARGNSVISIDWAHVTGFSADADEITFTPAGGVSSTNVQDAIVELDTEKAATASLAAVALSGSGSDIASGNMGLTSLHVGGSSLLTANNASAIPTLQVQGTNSSSSGSVNARFSANSSQPTAFFLKSRNASIGSHTIVQSGDIIGAYSFNGSDGTQFIQAAQIRVLVDGTPGTNDMPGRIELRTTADGAAASTTRMTIFNDGGSVMGSGSTSPGAGKLNLEGGDLLNNGTSPTGSGAYVRATSPTLVTPTLGAATATTINGNTFTTGTYTLTGTAAKTLNFTNSLTLSGTDSTTMTFPTTSATLARTDAANTFTGVQTFSTAIAVASGGTGVTTAAGEQARLGIGQLAFYLASANFNSTADQAITITLPTGYTRYRIQAVLVSNPSVSLTTAAGGFYTAASKGGTAFVAAGTVYSALTTNAANTSGSLANITVVNTNTAFYNAATLYLSLTTGQGSAATADVTILINPMP